MTCNYDVVVVGAGAAGIAAARRLRQAGRSTIVVEASDRVGGRAWTHAVDGMTLDLGCGWLHSAERNPLVAVAEAHGFPVDRTPSAWGQQYRELGFPPADQAAAQAAWAAFRQRLATDPPASDRATDALVPGDPWNAHAEALSGYMNGTGLDRLSVADFLAYDDAAGDANWRLPQGYGTLIAALMPPTTLSLANPVTAVDHGGGDIRVASRQGTITARAAIVTVSTAVLAAGTIRFTPAIGDHVEAAAHLPLGLADKLFLALGDDYGLDADVHLLGDPRRADTGSYYLRPLGKPVVEAFFGGAGAAVLEREGLAAAFAFASDELAALFGARIRSALRPVAGSNWGRMDRFGGSYSHALPGHAGCRAVLAQPVDDRLFFAGEATHATDFSTTHGAWVSGERAADETLTAIGAG